MDRVGRFETRYSSLGHPYSVWEPGVPRVNDDILDCVIYLYPSVADADVGRHIGGSGFLVGIPAKTVPGNFIYAVTNRHVIEGGSACIRLNTMTGAKDTRDYDERHWTFHPDGDDLAVCTMPAMEASIYKYRHVPSEILLTKERATELNIGPGDDVNVVGRFINHEGRQRNLPTMRFGNIAQMPWEPIQQIRVSGEPFDQESWLVEARSIGGYSGSPVFVEINPLWDRLNGYKMERGWRYLLGVDWGHINSWEPVRTPNDPHPIFRVRGNTGMMAVVPSWKLIDLLNLPALVERRAKDEELVKAKMGEAAASMDGIPKQS